MSDKTVFDPKGLIREAFAIEGIGAPEARSIFLDWALGVPQGRDMQGDVSQLIAHYAPQVPADHPMMQTLRAALQAPAAPRRRGGRQGRL